MEICLHTDERQSNGEECGCKGGSNQTIKNETIHGTMCCHVVIFGREAFVVFSTADVPKCVIEDEIIRFIVDSTMVITHPWQPSYESF